MAPLYTDMGELWSALLVEGGKGLGYPSIIALFIFGPLTFLIWRKWGVAPAFSTGVIGILLGVKMGLLPAWVSYIIYSLVAFLAVKTYIKFVGSG